MLIEKMQKRIENFLLKQELKKQKEKDKKKKSKKKKKEISITTTNMPIVKKRKVGRPKKRGPKKKRIRRKIIKIKKERPVVDFKIISVINGKQNGYIGSYQTYSDAFSKLNELGELNKSIVFPRKYINSGVISLIKEEYLLLEKNRFGDKTSGSFRNEFGKFVEQKILNSEKWVIRDKLHKIVEENFWVYGYDPKTDRKTASWIYENLITGSIKNAYDIVRIILYKNKLIIKYDTKPLSMILCKNKNDAIRLYNFVSEKQQHNKIKQIVCVGAFNLISDKRRELENEIVNLTGWTKTKVQRATN